MSERFGLKEVVQDTDKVVSICGSQLLKRRICLIIIRLGLIPESDLSFLVAIDFWPAKIAMCILFFSQIKKLLKIYCIVYS